MEVRVQYLLQEGSMLLPPTDTPLTGIEFTRRLPCGETERARKVGDKALLSLSALLCLLILCAGHASLLCHTKAVPEIQRTGRKRASPDQP